MRERRFPIFVGSCAAVALAMLAAAAAAQPVAPDDLAGAWRGVWTQGGYIVSFGEAHLTITAVEADKVTAEGSAVGVKCSAAYAYSGRWTGDEFKLSGAGPGCPDVRLTLEPESDNELLGRYKVVGGKSGTVELKRIE